MTNTEIQRLIEKLNYENSEMRDLLIDRDNDLKRENDRLKEAILILTVDYSDVWTKDMWKEVDTKLKKLGV